MARTPASHALWQPGRLLRLANAHDAFDQGMVGAIAFDLAAPVEEFP